MPAALPPCPVAIAVRPSSRDGGREATRDLGETINELARLLQGLGYEALLESSAAEEIGDVVPLHRVAMADIGSRCGLVVVLGGDGTFISVARQVAVSDVPVVGVNLGRLGFLTDLSLHTLAETLPQLLAGDYLEERRALICATSSTAPDQELLAVNDVVVYRGAATSLVDLEISLNERFAYGFRADGAIVATPTGSTAYALSANGPIMAPFVNAFTIVPIAPHALTNRPIVVADDSVVRITVARAREAVASIDGHHVIALQEGDSVVLRRAKPTVRLWHPLSYDYYHTLREKLGWTETPEGLAPVKEQLSRR